MVAAINRLLEWATIKRFIAAFLFSSFIGFVAMPWLHSRWMPDGSPGPLDLKFAYSAQDAAEQIQAFTDSGRAGYRLFLLTIDVIYPIAYTLMFMWAIALLQLRTRREKSMLPVAPALAAFVFDIMENVTISLMLTLHPDQPDALGWIASLFTTMKWLSIVLAIAAIFMLIVARLRTAKNVGAGEEI